MTPVHVALAILAPLILAAAGGAAIHRWWVNRDRSSWLRNSDVLTYARGTRARGTRNRVALDAARGRSRYWGTR